MSRKQEHDRSKRCFHNDSSLDEEDLYTLISVYTLPEAADSYPTVCPPKAQPNTAALRDVRKCLGIII